MDEPLVPNFIVEITRWAYDNNKKLDMILQRKFKMQQIHKRTWAMLAAVVCWENGTDAEQTSTVRNIWYTLLKTKVIDEEYRKNPPKKTTPTKRRRVQIDPFYGYIYNDLYRIGCSTAQLVTCAKEPKPYKFHPTTNLILLFMEANPSMYKVLQEAAEIIGRKIS